MKKIALFIVAAAMVAACSHVSNEQKMLEEHLKTVLTSPSSYKFVSFSQTGGGTLKDEVEERLSYFTESLDHDKEFCQSMYDLEQDSSAFDNLKMDQDVVNLLNGIKENQPAGYNDTTFREYTIRYESQNALGVMIQGTYVGRFDKDGKLIATRSEDGSWNNIGNFFSIPGYYEIVNQ